MKPVFNPFTAQLELKRDAAASGTSGVYHVDEWNGNLLNAIASVPAGAILQLGAGPYVGRTGPELTPDRITKGITLQGIGAPNYATDSSSLVGGTIIKGSLNFRGASNLIIRDLGFDCGPTWFATATGDRKNETNCLGIFDFYNVTLENVTTLNIGYMNETHCVVMTNNDRVSIRNLQTMYGVWGLVLKTKNTVVDGLYAESHGYGAFHVKSNANQLVENVKATNIRCRDSIGTSETGAGVFIYAATADTRNVQVSNFSCEGMENGVVLSGNPYINHSVVLTNGIVNAKGYGVYSSVSALNESAIVSDLVVNGDGRAMQIVGDQLVISNVIASTPTADANNVIINGSFSVSNLISCIGYDYGQKTGIVLNPTGGNQSRMRIGRVIGNVTIGSAANTMSLSINTSSGWTLQAGTGSARFRMEGSRMTVEARVSVPSGSRTGKEVVATFNSVYAPAQDVMMLAWGMTTVNEAPVPVVVRVTTSGQIRAEYVANSQQVPAGLTTLSLHGLSWLLNDL